MQCVLITGATGLVGQEIVKQCHAQDIAVHYLTTRKDAVNCTENYKGFYWNLNTGEIDIACFEGVDTIINLAGATIAKRWTKSYKDDVLNSRIHALKLLYSAIKEHKFPVKQIISASAIGIYPSSQTNFYEETYSDYKEGFLTKVCQQWEAEAQKFDAIGIKVTILRIGLVLSTKGGALSKLLKPIKYFAGSALGKGNQWQSWIHVEDLAAMFLFLAENKREGIYNAVAPNPVKQHQFVSLLAKKMSRPLLLPNVPTFVLKLVLGEMSALVLDSQRVSSKKIETIGFHFQYNYLQSALEDILKKGY